MDFNKLPIVELHLYGPVIQIQFAQGSLFLIHLVVRLVLYIDIGCWRSYSFNLLNSWEEFNLQTASSSPFVLRYIFRRRSY